MFLQGPRLLVLPEGGLDAPAAASLSSPLSSSLTQAPSSTARAALMEPRAMPTSSKSTASSSSAEAVSSSAAEAIRSGAAPASKAARVGSKLARAISRHGVHNNHTHTVHSGDSAYHNNNNNNIPGDTKGGSEVEKSGGLMKSKGLLVKKGDRYDRMDKCGEDVSAIAAAIRAGALEGDVRCEFGDMDDVFGEKISMMSQGGPQQSQSQVASAILTLAKTKMKSTFRRKQLVMESSDPICRSSCENEEECEATGSPECDDETDTTDESALVQRERRLGTMSKKNATIINKLRVQNQEGDSNKSTAPPLTRPRPLPAASLDSQSTASTDASGPSDETLTLPSTPSTHTMPLLVGELGRREESYEWLATNLYQFFKEVCLMADMCNEELEIRYPEVGQGFPPHYEYRWAPPLVKEKRKPVRMSGPEYVQHALGWVEGIINDRRYFPVDEETLFPDDFMEIITTVYTRLFRVYAILFHHCQDILQENEAGDFLHESFRHFMFIVLEYSLIRDREYKAMRAAVDHVKQVYDDSLGSVSTNMIDIGHIITAPIDPQVTALLASVTTSVTTDAQPTGTQPPIAILPDRQPTTILNSSSSDNNNTNNNENVNDHNKNAADSTAAAGSVSQTQQCNNSNQEDASPCPSSKAYKADRPHSGPLDASSNTKDPAGTICVQQTVSASAISTSSSNLSGITNQSYKTSLPLAFTASVKSSTHAVHAADAQGTDHADDRKSTESSKSSESSKSGRTSGPVSSANMVWRWFMHR